MKTSGKLLWGFILLISVIMIVGIVIVKIWDKSEDSVRASRETTTLEYSYDDIKEFVVSGVYDIEIIQGENNSLELTVPDNMTHLFTVTEDDGKVKVSFTSSHDDNYDASIVLTVSQIEKIAIEGVITMDLIETDLEDLTIYSEGITTINSEKGNVQNLYITGEGIGNFYLFDLKVKNCDFNFEGMGTSEIYIDGGKLSGDVEGMMNVKYSGSVSDFSLSLEGMGSIRNSSN